MFYSPANYNLLFSWLMYLRRHNILPSSINVDLILFVKQQTQRRGIKTTCITLDQPLYYKAVEISSAKSLIEIFTWLLCHAYFLSRMIQERIYRSPNSGTINVSLYRPTRGPNISRSTNQSNYLCYGPIKRPIISWTINKPARCPVVSWATNQLTHHFN